MPSSLIQPLRSTASESDQSDMYNMSISQSYNIDNKDVVTQMNSMSQHQMPEATLFQHSDSLPNYLLHNPSTLLHSLARNDQELVRNNRQMQFMNTPKDQQHQNNAPTMDYQVPIEETRNEQSMTQGLDVPSKTHNLLSHPIQPKERKRTNFLSSAADLEYSTLSSILQENVLGFNHSHLATSTEGTPTSVVLSPAMSPHGYGANKHSPSGLSTNNFTQSEGQSGVQSSYLEDESPSFDPKINQFQLGFTSRHPNVLFPHIVEVLIQASESNKFQPLYPHLHPSFTIGVPQNEIDPLHNDGLQFKEPEDIYATIKKPFLYTPGFHKLIAYLRGRFSKDKLVTMAESMAVYRPSFIACINSLRESDLIFMEQCFQRTLLTYDNFIKISGTPTIVWRRTGEIAYVGQEFTILTGWTQQQLMGTKPTFIVELLDDQSVVEYFQLFSKIAFGDFLGATMTECTLLTPNKDVKIRTGCIWTLKRDVFGIPMMIIGNFLPIV